VSIDNDIKRVVLCADDFGMSEAIDTGIIRLAEQGRLSAASCLSLGPTFARHAHALAGTGARMGLHLNFTESLGQPGLYLPLATLIRRAYARRLDVAVLRAQIQDQLEAFEAGLGRAPDFVDGHQHVHQLPQIRDVLLVALADRYAGQALPWLRSTRMAALSGLPVRQRAKAFVIQALGAAALGRNARRLGFHLNVRFAGVYDFRGGEPAFGRLLSSWLTQLQDGDLLMCHPAAHADAADPLGQQRLAEFKVLAGDDAGRWLEENRIQGRLARFGQQA